MDDDVMLKEHREAYEAVRQELEAKHMGCTALMHQGKVAGIYNDKIDAYRAGRDNYGLGNFTIKVIGEKPVYLGIQTMNIPG